MGWEFTSSLLNIDQIPQRAHSSLQLLNADDHVQYHPVGMRFSSTRYFNGTAMEGVLGNYTTVSKELRAWPFRIPIGVTVDRLAINVLTPQLGSTTYAAIYTSNAAESAPDLLLGALPLDTTTTGLKEVVFGSVFLGAQMIWLALVSDATGVILSALTLADAHLGTDDISTNANAASLVDNDSITPPTLPATFGAGSGVTYAKAPNAWPLYLKTV